MSARTATLIVSALSFCSNVHASDLNPKFERPLEGEAKYIERIRDGFLIVQARQKAEGGKVLRGTHAKGVCTKARFQVLARPETSDAELASRLKIGFYSRPDTYPAIVRFANAASEINADQVPDVRAVSIAVTTPPEFTNPQGRMDFSMNSAPVFPINDAHVFAATMTAFTKGLPDMLWHLWPSEVLAVKRAKAIGDAQSQPAEKPFQKMTYWSDVAFAHGQDHAVKYSAVPCDSNRSQPLTKNENALSLELARTLNEDSGLPTCFNFGLQLLDSEKMTDPQGNKHSAVDWVENATWEWKEAEVPFVTVARLTLEPGLLPADECERLTINTIKNTMPDHHGLGSINRARTATEEASAENRLRQPNR